MNKQQFKLYVEDYAKDMTDVESMEFLLLWHMYQKGRREGIRAGVKQGYNEGKQHAVYMDRLEAK